MDHGHRACGGAANTLFNMSPVDACDDGHVFINSDRLSFTRLCARLRRNAMCGMVNGCLQILHADTLPHSTRRIVSNRRA